MVKCLARLARNRLVVGSNAIKGIRCFIEQNIYSYCLVLVGAMNGFERDF